jgi:hypothetical protein
MSQPIRIETVDQILLDRSIKTGIKYEFEVIEQLVSDQIDKLGITTEEKAYLSALAISKEEYPIDAEDMMKRLGIANQNANATDIGRTLIRANVIPKLDLKELAQKATLRNELPNDTVKDRLVLYTNPKCQIVRVSEIKTGRKVHHSIKYNITLQTCYKVIMRAYNTDKYADYFLVQLQLIEKYKQYQFAYSIHLKELPIQMNRIAEERAAEQHRIDTERFNALVASYEESKKEITSALSDIKIGNRAMHRYLNDITGHLAQNGS